MNLSWAILGDLNAKLLRSDGKRALARLEVVEVPWAPINANEVSVPGGPVRLGKGLRFWGSVFAVKNNKNHMFFICFSTFWDFGSKIGQDRPKMSQERRKMSQDRLQDGPRWRQDAAKMGQDAAKMAQDRP